MITRDAYVYTTTPRHAALCALHFAIPLTFPLSQGVYQSCHDYHLCNCPAYNIHTNHTYVIIIGFYSRRVALRRPNSNLNQTSVHIARMYLSYLSMVHSRYQFALFTWLANHTFSLSMTIIAIFMRTISTSIIAVCPYRRRCCFADQFNVQSLWLDYLFYIM